MTRVTRRWDRESCPGSGGGRTGAWWADLCTIIGGKERRRSVRDERGKSVKDERGVRKNCVPEGIEESEEW